MSSSISLLFDHTSNGSAAIPLGEGQGDAAGGVVLDYLVIGQGTDDAYPVTPIVPATGMDRSEIERQVQELLAIGEAAYNRGDRDTLRAQLNKIVAIDPTNAAAYFNLGILNRDIRANPIAESNFRNAIKFDPKRPLYYQALGELMQIMHHLIFAAEAYENGLMVDPNHLAMLGSLTEVRQKQRMPQQVADLCRRVLALDPQASSAMISLAWALLWLGEVDEAADVAARALLTDPNAIQAMVIQQVAWTRLGKDEEAASILARIDAIAITTWSNCALAAEAFNHLDENSMAERVLRLIIERQPNFVPALQQLGRMMVLKGDLEQSFEVMSRVIELDPSQGDAQTSVALTLVAKGEFAEGWARHHWRWKRTGCEPRWDLPMPEWDGQRIDKGALLIWREQGIGDMIMYAAPAIACRDRVSKIVIETNPRLRAVLQRSFPDMTLISREDISETFFTDYNVVAHCPNGDLPHLLKLDMAAYPGRDGFLIAHPNDVRRLRERYQLLFPGKRLVGISWRSGNSSSATLRSIDLPRWMPIFETPDCVFISLQYGDISKEVEFLRNETGVEVYIDTEVDAMHDMDLFTAQVAAVDVVISVDNSTIHVSGALGKRTWAFIPSSADWRWMKGNRRDAMWYSSLTLLRQIPGVDWAEQIDEAASSLRELTPDDIDAERRAFRLRCATQSYKYKDFNVAELYFRQILAESQDHHPSLAGLGRIALQTGHFDDAISLLGRAADAAPYVAEYQRDLAKALYAGGRHQKAYDTLRQSLRIDGTDGDALTLGIEILRHLGDADEAANYCARLLRLEPTHREARLHLAQMQAGAGDFDVAETNFRRVLTEHPDDDIAEFSLGCLALRRGDLVAGWSGFARRYEAGLSSHLVDLKLAPLQEIWEQPDELRRARVAVRPEPGLKDQIMFLRWLLSLRQETDFVVADLDPRLIPLIDQRSARISLYPTGSLTADDADDLRVSRQIALGDLGQRYGRAIESLGDAVPYVQFDRERANLLRHNYLQALGVERLIGICWRGGDMAIPLIEWLPVLRLSGFGFVSLQAGPAQQELHDVFDGLSLSAIRDPAIDPQTNLRAFAAQIAAVDAVISIDEIPAHLAGALGVPTFCLLPTVADWRWFGDTRRDSPWYPSMQLYRQMSDGNWAKAMEQIVADLKMLATGRNVGNVS